MFRTSLTLALVVGTFTGCDADGTAPKPNAKPAASPKAAPAPTLQADSAGKPTAGAHHVAQPKSQGTPRDITPSGESTTEVIAELEIAAPKEWEKRPATSAMRLAQWTMPGPGGDGEMVVYRFAGGAGGVDANLARWKGQFVAPEGKTLDDITTVQTVEVGDGFKVTTVDIAGHYRAAAMPGQPQQRDETDARMLAAIIEGSGDAFFFKGLGPQKTMNIWAKPFETMLRAIKKKPA